MIHTIPFPVGLRPMPRKSIYLQENDAKALLWLAAKTAGTIIEIGCNRGDTTRDLARAFRKRRIVGVDWSDNGAMHEGQAHERLTTDQIGRRAAHLHNVTIVNGDSRQFNYARFAPVGFVFIDGDHSYEGVRADTERALALAPRPLIAWHDVSEGHPEWVGVLRYLKKLAEEHDVTRIADTWMAFL